MHLTGASGSGTTTLGHALASETGWQFLDADDFYWLPTDPPYTHKRERAERSELLRSAFDVARPHGVVLAGSVVGWADDCADACDLIVYLLMPTAVRLQRLRDRELRERGRVDEAFLAWAANYDEG